MGRAGEGGKIGNRVFWAVFCSNLPQVLASNLVDPIAPISVRGCTRPGPWYSRCSGFPGTQYPCHGINLVPGIPLSRGLPGVPRRQARVNARFLGSSLAGKNANVDDFTLLRAPTLIVNSLCTCCTYPWRPRGGFMRLCRGAAICVVHSA